MEKLYNFNPFGGILSEELHNTIVPQVKIPELIEFIKTKHIAIEFCGKKGRGKTTHLKYLHSFLSHYPYFELNAKADFLEILKSDAEVIFIDSIHHLSFLQRIQLLKKKRVVIYTTHSSRRFSCFLINKKFKKLAFSGIQLTTLEEIVNKRLKLASNKSNTYQISKTDLKKLIHKYGDNYRAILNHLYEKHYEQSNLN